MSTLMKIHNAISDTPWPLRAIMVLIATLVVALPFLIYSSVQAHNDRVDACAAQGGRVVSDSKTVTTVGHDGKVGTGVSTTYYCLNEQGGIIDIW